MRDFYNHEIIIDEVKVFIENATIVHSITIIEDIKENISLYKDCIIQYDSNHKTLNGKASLIIKNISGKDGLIVTAFFMSTGSLSLSNGLIFNVTIRLLNQLAEDYVKDNKISFKFPEYPFNSKSFNDFNFEL